MIKIVKRTIVPKDNFYSTENQARIHVLPNEPWVAFEIPKESIIRYEIATLEVSYKEFKQNFTALAVSDIERTYIVAAQGLAYNDLYAAHLDGGTDEDMLVVPITSAVGFIDKLHRRKYISTTARPFWNSKMLPIVLTKD